MKVHPRFSEPSPSLPLLKSAGNLSSEADSVLASASESAHTLHWGLQLILTVSFIDFISQA